MKLVASAGGRRHGAGRHQLGEDENFLRSTGPHLKEAGVKPGMKARDVWGVTDLGVIKDEYKLSVKRHPMLLLRFTK